MEDYIVIQKAKKGTNALMQKVKTKQFTSLSHVLKHIKSKGLWDACFADVFATIGVTNPIILTPAWFLNNLSQKCIVEKNGKPQLCIWGMKTLKDEQGNPILNRNGTPVKEPVARVVSTWTPNTVIKLIAQSRAFNEEQLQIDKMVL